MGLSDPGHTPARCGAAGVISLSAVLGDPIPIVDALILAGKSTKTRTNWSSQRTIRVFPQPRAGLGVSGLIAAVLQHLQFLQRDEAAIHHSVKNRQKLIDLLFRIHDFNNQGQIQ
jgi:hypothetical protein